MRKITHNTIPLRITVWQQIWESKFRNKHLVQAYTFRHKSVNPDLPSMHPLPRRLMPVKLESLASIPISSSRTNPICALEMDHHQDLILITVLRAAMQGFAFVLGASLLSLHKMPDHAFSRCVPLSVQNHYSNHHYADWQALLTTFNMPSLLTMTNYCISDPFTSSASTYFMAATNEA